MKHPPAIIKLVVESVCIMKNIKPDRKPDPGGSGKMIDDLWGPAQKMLGDMNFLASLKSYDKDNIDNYIMRKIRDSYISNPDFDPEKVMLCGTGWAHLELFTLNLNVPLMNAFIVRC